MNALPVNVLVPDLVTAVMIALDAFSYSALKFAVVMRNSCTALRGNGLPRLSCCPATPPTTMSFLYDAPSTKTLIACAVWAPAEKVLLAPSTRSGSTRTPGASAARSRKLRLAVGRLLICACVTFVATSDVRRSAPAAVAVTTTVPSCVAVCPIVKF